MVPAVRERQRNPRFLTIAAVGNIICSEIAEDTFANDEVQSEPWQVYEWYVVEGLIRTLQKEEVRGIAGSHKAQEAVKNHLSLSAKRYLKTPSVFGFHGIYRILANALDILDSGRLGETGFHLVNVWEKEQGIEDFCSKEDSENSNLRRRFSKAVREGLQKGEVCNSGQWGFIRKYLAPHECGPEEAKVIYNALIEDAVGYRKEVIEYLLSDEGRYKWITTESEKAFHLVLQKRVGGELKELLSAIIIYEQFSRALQDAFDDCLHIMTKNKTKTSPEEMCKSGYVITASKKVPELYSKVLNALEPFGESARFEGIFGEFYDKHDPVSWVRVLLEHHRTVQRKKPPNGKNSWFEMYDGGNAYIRPGYYRHKPPEGDNEYVHMYRTNSLWEFMINIKKVKADEQKG